MSVSHLIKNGSSGYKILLPKEPSKNESRAAAEFEDLFFQACGIKLKRVADGVKDDGCVISIGETALAKEFFRLKNTAALGECGYAFAVDSGKVFLCGGGDLGTIYAVHGFFSKYFGFEVYAADEYSLERGVKDKKIRDIYCTDKPDIPYRNAYGARYYSNEYNAHKMKSNTYSEVFIRDSYQPWHNSFRFLPPAEYNNPEKPESYHPKWYIEQKLTYKGEVIPAQLHFTARGDAAELDLMRKTLLDKMIAHIERSFAEGKYLRLICFTQEDHEPWADDASVDYYKKKYKKAANAATLICFLNPIARELKKYMQKNHPGREMNIITFAYWQTKDAPVKRENGKYVPIDDDVRPEDNLYMLFAAVAANYSVPLSHPLNRKPYLLLKKWRAVANSISFWTYSYYVINQLMFHDTFGSMPENFKLMKRCNAFYSFNESNWNYGDVAFNAYKIYLGAKLQWKTDSNTEKLKKDFFDNFYRQASESMLKLFDQLRAYYARLTQEKDFSAWIFNTDTAKPEYWPLEEIDRFLSIQEEAYQAIEPLKASDIYLYNTLSGRIYGDGLMFNYLKIQLYPDSVADLLGEKNRFKDYCSGKGITLLASYIPLTDLWEKWF